MSDSYEIMVDNVPTGFCALPIILTDFQLSRLILDLQGAGMAFTSEHVDTTILMQLKRKHQITPFLLSNNVTSSFKTDSIFPLLSPSVANFCYWMGIQAEVGVGDKERGGVKWALGD